MLLQGGAPDVNTMPSPSTFKVALKLCWLDQAAVLTTLQFNKAEFTQKIKRYIELEGLS
jgi:hypothetical protein